MQMLNNARPLDDHEAPLPGPKIPAPPVKQLKRITARHHLLAMYLANGQKKSHAAMLLGMTPATVSRLLKDPAFENLVAEYRERLVTEAGLFTAHLQALGLEAVQNLLARIEENPDDFSARELHGIVQDTADRFGPPKISQLRVQNEGLAERLERARSRARDLSQRAEEEIVEAVVVSESRPDDE